MSLIECKPCGCEVTHIDGGHISYTYCGDCREETLKEFKTEEETKMTNINKHGVNYSEIEIGDLVKLDMKLGGDVLGYVTYVDSDKLKAIWSDDFEECHESFSTGKICGHWKVVVHEPKELVPAKPYGQLISYISLVDGKEKWGVFTHKKGNKYYAHFSDYGKGFLFERDIVVHPTEKKPFFKEGDTVVVTSMRPIDSKGHQEALGLELTVTGYDDKDDYYGQWYWLKHSTEGVFLFPDCNLTLKEDLENPSAAQELSVHQESANFAHAAVQGIINAHAEKNREASEDDTMLNTFSHEDLNDSYAKGYHEATMNYLDSFTFSDFDKSVARTWKDQDFKDAVTNAALGLTGEAGEVADLIKKAEYHGRGWKSWSNQGDTKAISKEDVLDELSDVLFYVSGMAQEFGFTLEDVAKHNKEKLEKRFPEGFSTEASAQKRDKHERKFPFKAKVIGDRDGNLTGYHHGLDYGTVVTVTGENFSKCYIADSLTIFKDDLEEVTD